MIGGQCRGGSLFATLSDAIPPFIAHRNARPNGRIGLEPEATRVAHLFVEQDHRAVVPDGAMAKHFNRVLQFVPDVCHEVAIRRPRFHKDPQHSVWAGYRHRV
jgi:hypothetical protein